MPSPIFHSVAALATAVSSRKTRQPFAWSLAALLVLASNLPDFDLIPAIFFGVPPMVYHHGFTHSFFFCLLAALLFSLVPSAQVAWGRRFTLLALVACSHPIFDLLNANGSPECQGNLDCAQPLVWPFLARKWNTFYPVFGDLRLTTGFFSWFSHSNMLILALECGYALLLFTVIWVAGIRYRNT